MASLLLAAPDAYAGTYTWTTKDASGNITAQSPVYSGGTCNRLGTSYSDAAGSPGWEGASLGVNNVTCSGPIKATFTWAPAAGLNMVSDPPPTQVIQVETGAAQVNCNSDAGMPVASASCNDGLGGSKTATPTILSSGSSLATCSSSDIKYSVVAGGPSVSATETLTATGFGERIGGGINYGNSAYVTYTAALYPFTIAIAGTNNPTLGDYRALTGQQISAILATPNGTPYGTKLTGYTWSFSGGNPIKGWDPNAPGDGQPTQVLPLLPTDYIAYPAIGSTTVPIKLINFYDEVANDAVTVKCAATIQLPDGTTQTVNTISPQVTFLKPTLQWTVQTGYVRGVTDPKTSNYGYGLEPVSNSNGNNGEAWSNVTINVPAPFFGGQGCFAQLITPNTTVTNDDPTKSPVFSGNGQQGLDNSFPYRGYTWTIPAAGVNADGPAFVFSYYNNPIYQGFNTVTVSDQFTTWVMYMPPAAVSGQGTIWVPLQSYSWKWSFTSLWNNQWPLTTSSPTAGNDPGYKPTGVMNTPPQWGITQINSH